MRLLRFKGVIRRIILNYFRKSYVEKQLSRRRGKCDQCGKCCELAFRCPFLTASRKCLIYDIWRPTHCRSFPLDQKDLEEVGGECGYFFA